MKLWLLPLTVAMSLCACVQKVETRVQSQGTADPAAQGYIWNAPEKVESRELELAQKLVAQRLQEKGFAAATDGKLYLEVGVASRPASLALAQSGEPLALAGKKRDGRNCKWNEYRVAVTLSRISDGQDVYRGYAGEFHCKYGFGQVLPALVDAALADFGKPRGTYLMKRKLN